MRRSSRRSGRRRRSRVLIIVIAGIIGNFTVIAGNFNIRARKTRTNNKQRFITATPPQCSYPLTTYLTHHTGHAAGAAGAAVAVFVYG